MPAAQADERPEDDVVPAPAHGRGIRRLVTRAGALLASWWPRLDARSRREIILALVLLFCYGFFRQAPAWNEYSRYDLVRALAEDGTTSIDRYHENTGDKAFYNGHYYSDKAPGTAFLGLPVYLLLTLTSGATGAGAPDPLTAVQALAFGVSGIPTVLLVLLLLRFLRHTVGESWGLTISLGYGLGSIAFPFATMFFGHAASTFFLFAAFYLLWSWRADHRNWRLLFAGFLAGWSVLTEIPAALGVAVLGLYALWLGRDQALRFALGGVPILLVLMTYNWLTFDSPFSIGYQYATVFGEQNRQGVFSIVWPSWSTTSDLLFSPRGLLRLAPWFSVAPLGLLAARRRATRAEVLVSAAIVVAFLTYNSGALNPFGGWTPGPRYLLPALPFAAVLVAVAPRVLRPLVAFQMAVAVVLFFVATVTMPNAPEMYRDPLTELWLPRLLNRDIAETTAWLRWGLHGIQPLLVFTLALAVGALGLLATLRSDPVARHLASIFAGALVLLLVAFAVPIAPLRGIDFTIGESSTPPVGSIAIVDVGVTPMLTADQVKAVIWAQAENRGPALDSTRVVFTVTTPTGKPTWSASYGDVSWRAGERKRLAVEWDTQSAQDGDYPVDVTVVSQDPQVVYANADKAALVHLRR